MHTGRACSVSVEQWLLLFRETIANLLTTLVFSDHQCLAWEFSQSFSITSWYFTMATVCSYVAFHLSVFPTRLGRRSDHLVTVSDPELQPGCLTAAWSARSFFFGRVSKTLLVSLFSSELARVPLHLVRTSVWFKNLNQRFHLNPWTFGLKIIFSLKLFHLKLVMKYFIIVVFK